MSDRCGYEYPSRVRLEIPDRDLSAYGDAADCLDSHKVDLLSVQHEYGIFGGEAGSHLLTLLRQVNMPVVTTLHTVLKDPSPVQKRVMDEILLLSTRVVVMSRKAVDFLRDIHCLCPDKIDLIPHGIPKIQANPESTFRKSLGIEGPMILTFGLLSPDKGIQYMIEAMPEIVKQHPGATYVIVGATHPNIRASSGESYREGLVCLARKLGVAANVRFVDGFATLEDLVQYLAAMDYYVTPYLNPMQITSGTLAYSLGAGKVVISTPYWYAQELLEDGRGMIVPFRDSAALAAAILTQEGDPCARAEMGGKAAECGKQMLWPRVAEKYLASFRMARQHHAEVLGL
jgi:glycosyltransferase involved in cell wall biosynthesis